MPVYVYGCRTCKQTFEKRHGMFYQQDRCIHCASEDIYKVPSLQTIKKNSLNSENKPGKIVDQYIRDTKEEIKKNRIKYNFFIIMLIYFLKF